MRVENCKRVVENGRNIFEFEDGSRMDHKELMEYMINNRDLKVVLTYVDTDANKG